MSTTTDPRSETVETQNPQPLGSRSKGFRGSNIEKSDLENEDHPLRASGSEDLRHPAKPLYRDELDLDQMRTQRKKIITNADLKRFRFYHSFYKLKHGSVRKAPQTKELTLQKIAS